MKMIKKVMNRIANADPSIWGYQAMGYYNPVQK